MSTSVFDDNLAIMIVFLDNLTIVTVFADNIAIVIVFVDKLAIVIVREQPRYCDRVDVVGPETIQPETWTLSSRWIGAGQVWRNRKPRSFHRLLTPSQVLPQ